MTPRVISNYEHYYIMVHRCQQLLTESDVLANIEEDMNMMRFEMENKDGEVREVEIIFE